MILWFFIIKNIFIFVILKVFLLYFLNIIYLINSPIFYFMSILNFSFIKYIYIYIIFYSTVQLQRWFSLQITNNHRRQLSFCKEKTKAAKNPFFLFRWPFQLHPAGCPRRQLCEVFLFFLFF